MTLKQFLHKKPQLCRYFIGRKNKIILLTNGKCGGTSLHRWFFEVEGYGNIKSSKYYPYLIKKIVMHSKVQALYNSPKDSDFRLFVRIYRRFIFPYLRITTKLSDYKKVIVVRDPYERLVSGFIDKFCKEDRNKNFVIDIVEKVRKDKVTDKGITFREFVGFICSSNNNELNGHWRSQSFILSLFKNNIFPIELKRFDEKITQVDAAFKYSIPLQKRNKREEDKAKVYQCTIDVCSSKLHGNKSLLIADNFYDEDLKLKVMEFYKSDYKLFHKMI